MQLGKQLTQLNRSGTRTFTIRTPTSSPLRGHRLVNDIRATLGALPDRSQHAHVNSSTLKTADSGHRVQESNPPGPV